MPKTIESVPEYITREQWVEFIRMCGFRVDEVIELRLASDGVHALVKARFEDGSYRVDRTPGGSGHYKHRVFIPTRDEGDTATTRITRVKS